MNNVYIICQIMLILYIIHNCKNRYEILQYIVHKPVLLKAKPVLTGPP
jgi:hypothetical protein